MRTNEDDIIRWIIIGVVVLVGSGLLISECRGCQRKAQDIWAGGVGADWIIIERRLDGTPYQCWMLEDVSVANEGSSDGIYWENENGNLIHISGSYDRVQVLNDHWSDALEEINMTREACNKVQSRTYDPGTQTFK